MRKEETRGIGERRFDDYYSAFLSASSSVIDGVLRQGDAVIAAKFKAWKDALTSEQKDLYDFMREDRNQEVHRGGSRRSVKVEKSPVTGSYEDPAGGGTVQAFSAPNRSGIRRPFPSLKSMSTQSTSGASIARYRKRAPTIWTYCARWLTTALRHRRPQRHSSEVEGRGIGLPAPV
jgi:hypothetical protein